MTKKTSDNGIKLIKVLEGFSSRAYYCAGGVLTIGYGHTNVMGTFPFTESSEWTEQKATEALRSDLMSCERDVSRLVKVELNQNQFDALVSFVFNIGYPAFEDSTLLKKINTKALNEEIVFQWKRWNKASGIVNDGLAHRRLAESNLFCREVGDNEESICDNPYNG